jgi:hypothetical protein
MCYVSAACSFLRNEWPSLRDKFLLDKMRSRGGARSPILLDIPVSQRKSAVQRNTNISCLKNKMNSTESV